MEMVKDVISKAPRCTGKNIDRFLKDNDSHRKEKLYIYIIPYTHTYICKYVRMYVCMYV